MQKSVFFNGVMNLPVGFESIRSVKKLLKEKLELTLFPHLLDTVFYGD